jgi:hypothetical protein
MTTARLLKRIDRDLHEVAGRLEGAGIEGLSTKVDKAGEAMDEVREALEYATLGEG